MNNPITGFLDSEIALLQRSKIQERNGYLSLSHFVRTHGIDFDTSKVMSHFVRTHGIDFDTSKVKPCHKGPLKQCFMNSAQLAMRDKNLIYVEGYAAAIIPVMHAWCVTRNGEIVEPTWRSLGSAYLGIPFQTALSQATSN